MTLYFIIILRVHETTTRAHTHAASHVRVVGFDFVNQRELVLKARTAAAVDRHAQTEQTVLIALANASDHLREHTAT